MNNGRGETTRHARLKRLAFLWAQAHGYSACAMEVSLPRCRYRGISIRAADVRDSTGDAGQAFRRLRGQHSHSTASAHIVYADPSSKGALQVNASKRQSRGTARKRACRRLSGNAGR